MAVSVKLKKWFLREYVCVCVCVCVYGGGGKEKGGGCHLCNQCTEHATHCVITSLK